MSMNFDQMTDSRETVAPRRGRIRDVRRRPEYIIAGLPTVSLLPRELKTAAHEKSIRRALVAGVVVALAIAGAGTAGAVAMNVGAQSRLEAANADSSSLLRQLGTFKDVQTLQQQIALGSAAKTVGSSSEIDWQAQIDAIEQDMPSGYAVSTITADSASAVADYPQGSSPLEQPRAATFAMTIKTSSITELPIWLRKLRSITAYADATAAVSSGEGEGYQVILTVHLSPKALVNAKKADN